MINASKYDDLVRSKCALGTRSIETRHKNRGANHAQVSAAKEPMPSLRSLGRRAESLTLAAFERSNFMEGGTRHEFPRATHWRRDHPAPAPTSTDLEYVAVDRFHRGCHRV